MSALGYDPLVEVIGQRVRTPEDGEGLVARLGQAEDGRVVSVVVDLDYPVDNGEGERVSDLQYPPSELEPV